MVPVIPKRELLLLGAAYREVDEILRWPEGEFYKVADTVSDWSPAQQVLHIGLVNAAIFRRIELLYADESPDILRTGGPNLSGWAVLTFSYIPRRKAQAPKELVPPPDVDRIQARAAILASKKHLPWLADKAAVLDTLRGRLPHFALGNLTALQWLKLARIHTRFHLGIAGQIRHAPASVRLET